MQACYGPQNWENNNESWELRYPLVGQEGRL
jgi:hypothetical protein